MRGKGASCKEVATDQMASLALLTWLSRAKARAQTQTTPIKTAKSKVINKQEPPLKGGGATQEKDG